MVNGRAKWGVEYAKSLGFSIIFDAPYNFHPLYWIRPVQTIVLIRQDEFIVITDNCDGICYWGYFTEGWRKAFGNCNPQLTDLLFGIGG